MAQTVIPVTQTSGKLIPLAIQIGLIHITGNSNHHELDFPVTQTNFGKLKPLAIQISNIA